VKSLRDSKIFRSPEWFSKWKQKEARERAREPTALRILTFAMTFGSIMAGLSYLPLFPQPLPLLIALMVAFVTFINPMYGMPIGSALIGLGLIYSLSALNFIVSLGAPVVRVIAIFVFLFLFTVLPILFHRYKAAIAINLGIFAAVFSFFGEAYYLAVPLILISAVFLKKSSILTGFYYISLTVPLEIVQYSKYIAQATRPDWWVVAGSSPPVYVPLAEVLRYLQETMLQFRLYDSSKVIYTITGQVTSNPPVNSTINSALSQYLDSLPGIALFLAVVVGVAFGIVFLADMLFPDKKAIKTQKFLLILKATFAAAVFFFFLGALQDPLAFRAEIDGSKIIIGVLATAMLSMPIFLVDLTPKQKATLEMIREKAKELMAKLQGFEALLDKVKSSIPLEVSSIEGKMLITKDKLDNILRKTASKFFDPSDIDDTFNELNRGITTDINNLISDLDLSLRRYQIYNNGEYSTWIGKFKDIGLETELTVRIDSQREQTPEMRVDSIKEVLDGGHSFVTESLPTVERIYGIIRSLYDPTLPEESPTVTFMRQKLEKETPPWIALEALFKSLINWRKQYHAEISTSVENLQNSLTSIARLTNQSERLLPIFGDNLSKIIAYAEDAASIKISIAEKSLNVMDITVIQDALQSSLSIAKNVLTILYEELNSTEKSIESLLPTKDYLWEKNVSLKERMTSAMEIINDPSTHGLKKVMDNLPKALSYIDECVETIAIYKHRKELLLNYPIAEIAIKDLLEQKSSISAQDLPFEHKCTGEYLRLFYNQRFREFAFDQSNMLLIRREQT
jgi:hypothetical protein